MEAVVALLMDVVAFEVLRRHLIDMVNHLMRLCRSHLQTFSASASHQRIIRPVAVQCSLCLLVLPHYRCAFSRLLL